MAQKEAQVALRTLVLGGARSGKSGYAEGLVTAERAVSYVATAKRDPADADWDARIAEHVERRPDDWQTVELGAAQELPALLDKAVADGPTLLVDDLATWLTRLLDETDAWSGGTDAVAAARQQVGELCTALRNCVADVVLVSAEAGLGVVPTTPAGRLFRDELGALNTAVAEVCPRTVLVVAGIPVALRGELPTPDTAQPTTPSTATSPAAASTGTAAGVAAVAGVAGVSAAAVTAGATTSTQTTPSESTVDAADTVTFPPVLPPDEQVWREAEARQQQLTKPAGSLGRLEELGVWISACQGVCPPKPLASPRVVVFAGDHGVADRGVSAFPKEVTGQMVANFLHGGAAVNVLAEANGASVRVVDMSVDGDTAEQISKYKVRRASGSIDREDALTPAEVNAALAAGRAIADEEVDSGADLLVAGDMGIANTTPSAVLIAALTGMEPVDVIGRGTGIDDEGWMRKAIVIRDALRRARKVATDPVALLRTAGGADLAAMAGFLAQAAIRRTPVLLDGVVVGAAAMVAEELAPGAKQWWVAGHQSVEPAHRIVLNHLGRKPLLDLGMRLGEGSGAVTALPLVGAAVRILSGMATFAEAGVSDKDAPVG